MRPVRGVGGFRNAEEQARYFAAYERAMAECPAPGAVLDVATWHGTTRVYRFGGGDAPPLVLLPGLKATAACWAPFLPAFAAHHPVYAVDTLGEGGRSVQTRPFEGIRDRARCLDEVLDRLDLTGIHVVGGSTGGWHAVNQAVHAPDRLASISLLDPTTVTAGFSPAVTWYGLVGALVGRDRYWLWFLRRVAGEDVADDPALRLALAGIRAHRGRVPFQRLPAEEDLRALRVPVLALFGGRSAVHDAVAAADRLRALRPDAEVEVLPDMGHHIPARLVDDLAGRVLGFVSRLPPGRVPGPAARPPRASPWTG